MKLTTITWPHCFAKTVLLKRLVRIQSISHNEQEYDQYVGRTGTKTAPLLLYPFGLKNS